jgi:hypothetical protein
MLPKDQALSEKDTVLPLNPFSDTSSRALIFTALVCGSTLILHPLTEPLAQENLSSQLHPSVIIASTPVVNLLTQTIFSWRRDSFWQSISLSLNQSRLTSGRLSSGLRPARKSLSMKLRLIYFTQTLPGSQPVASHILDLLRSGFGSHIIYSLSAPCAFGPIAQTHIHDYRVDAGTGAAHFGAPTGGAEMKLSGLSDEGGVSLGKIGMLEVRGPVVVGRSQWVQVGVKGKWRPDGCLAIE